MDPKSGSEIAGLKAVSFASGLFGDAEGTEFGDVVVVEFSPDIESAFFGGYIYPVDEAATSWADIDDDDAGTDPVEDVDRHVGVRRTIHVDAGLGADGNNDVRFGRVV